MNSNVRIYRWLSMHQLAVVLKVESSARPPHPPLSSGSRIEAFEYDWGDMGSS